MIIETQTLLPSPECTCDLCRQDRADIAAEAADVFIEAALLKKKSNELDVPQGRQRQAGGGDKFKESF